MKRLLLFAALIAWSGMAGAVIYKWVDAQGKLQYGDRPPDGVHAEVVELLGTHVARTAAPAKASGSPATGTAAKTANPDDAAAKQAVSEDVEQARAKQCADAQDRYKKLIDGRHLYKTGSNGERQYLTSEEIDTERLAAKQDVDSSCASSP
jgi:hypothetical protein